MERLKEKILALCITYKELISLLSEKHLHTEVRTDLPKKKKKKNGQRHEQTIHRDMY